MKISKLLVLVVCLFGGMITSVNICYASYNTPVAASSIIGVLGVNNGGTGLLSLGTAGQALVVNGAGTGLEYGAGGS